MLFRKINKSNNNPDVKKSLNNDRKFDMDEYKEQLPNELKNMRIPKCAIYYDENNVYFPNGVITPIHVENVVDTFNRVDNVLNVPSYEKYKDLTCGTKLMYRDSILEMYRRSTTDPFLISYKSLIDSLIYNIKDMLNEHTDFKITDIIHDDNLFNYIKITHILYGWIRPVNELILSSDVDTSKITEMFENYAISGIVNKYIYESATELYYMIVSDVNKILSKFSYIYPDKMDAELYNIIMEKCNSLFSLFMAYSITEVETLMVNLHSNYLEIISAYDVPSLRNIYDENSDYE